VITDRHIFHADCNSFFASVEETFRPELRLVPMSVAGDPENRHGIILASNILAKQRGVKTAETVWSAKQKCLGADGRSELVLVPPRHKTYSEFCERVNAIYEQYSPLVERFGLCAKSHKPNYLLKSKQHTVHGKKPHKQEFHKESCSHNCITGSRVGYTIQRRESC
jgi:hypothetical protein